MLNFFDEFSEYVEKADFFFFFLNISEPWRLLLVCDAGQERYVLSPDREVRSQGLVEKCSPGRAERDEMRESHLSERFKQTADFLFLLFAI